MRKNLMICSIIVAISMLFVSCGQKEKVESVDTSTTSETKNEVETATPSNISTSSATNTTPSSTNLIGHAIEEVQTRLNELGYVGANGKDLIVDGNFGANSIFALKRFQNNSDLPQTGEIDVETEEKLFSKSAAKATSADIPQVASSGNSSTANNASTTNNTSSNVNTEGLSLKPSEIRKLIDQGATYDKLKNEYSLQIVDQYLETAFEAKSSKYTKMEWVFTSEPDNPKLFKLASIGAPASLMLPKYVNMKVSQIPILLEQRGEIIYVTDSVLGYCSVQLTKAEVLSKNDTVYVSNDN